MDKYITEIHAHSGEHRLYPGVASIQGDYLCIHHVEEHPQNDPPEVQDMFGPRTRMKQILIIPMSDIAWVRTELVE